MSFSKVLTFSTLDLPKFDGHNYKFWLEKVTPYMMMTNLIDILNGMLDEPLSFTHTVPEVPSSTGETPADLTAWSRYSVLIGQYNLQKSEYSKAKKKYNKQNMKALGVFHICLSTGIWDQVKKKSAVETWAWLYTQYSVQQFVEILEDFKFLINFKLNLSDFNPQLTDF